MFMVGLKLVWGFVLKQWKWILLGMVLLYAANYIRVAENLKDANAELKSKLKAVSEAHEKEIARIEAEFNAAMLGYEDNKLSLDECLTINAENAIAKYNTEKQMAAAVSRVLESRKETDKRIDKIRDEAKNYTDDQVCRTSSGDLPDSGLRD